MSEAPRRMASSITLLTKRTIGASSTSSRRIFHRQKQPLAATEDRQHAMLGEELVADESNGLEVEGQRVKIEQRHAEFVRGGYRDVTCVGRTARHQLGDDTRLALACGIDRLEHRALVDHAVLHQALGQPAEAPAGGAER